MSADFSELGFDEGRIEDLRTLVQKLVVEEGLSYTAIASMYASNLQHHDVRNFSTGRSKSERIIIEIYKALSKIKKSTSNRRIDMLIERIERRSTPLSRARMLASLVGIEAHEFERVVRKYRGKYYCYRFSSRKNHIVRSLLQIGIDEEYEFNPIFTHKHYSPSHREFRDTEGYVIPVASKIYLIGKLPRPFGMKLMVLLERIDTGLLPGLVISDSPNRSPIAARMIAIRIKDSSERKDLEILSVEQMKRELPSEQFAQIKKNIVHTRGEEGVMQMFLA